MPREIGRFTRAWLRWRGVPQGLLKDHEEWNEATRSWGRAQHVGRVNFDDVVYVLGRSKGVSKDRLTLPACIHTQHSPVISKKSTGGVAVGNAALECPASRGNENSLTQP